MKKILFFVSALAGLFFAASCQQEEFAPVEESNVVTFEVGIPEVATKAEVVDNGNNINDLVYAVYRTDATSLEAVQADKSLLTLLYQKNYDADETTFVTVNGKQSAYVPVELLNNGQNFVVVFWAQVEDKWVGEDFDLLNGIGYPAGMDANNSDFAAFTGISFLKSDNLAAKKSIELKRPFAQINVASTLPSQIKDVVLSTSTVKVMKAGKMFDVINQVASETETVEFIPAELPEGDLTVAGNTYKYIAMNYVFASGNVEVEYTINTANHGTIKNTVSNVPVAANYRTNIVGSLLTSTADYTVTLAPFDENSNSGTVEVVTEGIVKNQNGDYEVSNENGLAYAINNLFVDAAGAANPATFYVKPGIYDMAQQAINDITVTSGTLKVYDTEAVVTRSATTGSVVIKGLKKAIIKEVKEDATLFFSGITIIDFNGADDAAALVQTNEGKVVLAGCDIVNGEGKDTELVGGNDPVEVEKGEEAAGDLIYTAEQLAAAFADESVESIVLGADITLENTLVFPEGRTATLDLRGWELTVNEPASNYAVNNHGTLTIKDSYATGEVNARGIYNGYVAEGDPITGAKLTIESGSFNAMGTNGGAAVYNYGQAEIKGGKFQSNGGYGLNSQAGAVMTVTSADVRGGIYNCGNLTVTESEVYQHLSGKHCIYNWQGTVTIESGEFDSESGNELILADGQNASVVINGGEFHKTAKSWLYGAATGKDITFTINGGTHYGYVNEPEMTVDTFRPYGDPIVVTGGSYNFDVTKWCAKDYKVVKNAETAMWDVVEKVYVAQAGEEKYESLPEAVENATNGATITFLADIEQVDGVLITDKNLIVDLNNKTFTVTNGANTNNRNFKINGSSVVTIKNGTMVAAGDMTSGAYGTVRTEDSANVTLNNVKSYSYRGYGLNIKANTGTTITINDSEIYAQYSGGVEAAGGEIVLNNVKIIQEGVYSSGAWCSVAIGVNGGGKVTVKSGEYSAAAIATDSNAAQGTWVAYVMSSGGTLEINGGTFNGTVAETAAAANACGLICADTKAVVNIYDGTFNSNGAILDMRNNTGGSPNPVATLYGGTFSADPTVSGLYSSNLISVVEGFEVYQEGQSWKLREKGIRSWTEFTQALAAGETELKLQADITCEENYQLQKAVTIDLNEYSMTLPMINIHTKTTVKNGTINGKVYARKNSDIVFDNVKFSGAVADNLSTEGHLAIQGGCKSLYAKDCLFSPTSVSGSQTKPLSFEGGSTQIKFENCEFKSSPYKKQVYLNSLSATGTIDFTNCNFNNKTPNIMLAATCPFTNVTMSGTTKLSSVTLETNRAKDSVTADDLAYLRTMIANNSFSSVRLFYAGGSDEYIR